MRFHMGVSFRPKQIIKWIIPILAILGILGISEARAEEYYTQVQLLPQNISFCDIPITEYIDYFEQYKGENYEFFVTKFNQSVGFTFYPRIPSPGGVEPNNYLTADYGIINWLKLGSTTTNYNGYAYYNTFTLFINNQKCENIDFRDSVTAQSDFISWMETYHDFYTNYQTIFNNVNETNMSGTSYRYQDTGSKVYVSNENGLYTAYVEFDYTSKSQYLIYTSRPLFYDENPTGITTNNPKKLKLNNVLYETGMQVDLGYEYTPVLTYDDYTQINDVYVYTTTTNLNRVNFKINYQTRDNNWEDSNLNLVGVYGQKNVGNATYTFDRIENTNCSWTSTTTNNSITFNGISCTIPNNYNSLSLHFNITGYTGIKNPLYDLSLINNASSYSNVYINDSNNWVSQDWVFPLILSSFDNQNVGNNYNYFLSTNNSSSNISIRTNNNGLWIIPYTINPLQENNLYSKKMIKDNYTNYNNGYYYKINTLGTTSNLGYLITSNTGYNYPNNYNIAFFGNTGDYVSINNDMNYCYYYNGSISCKNINTDEYKGIAQGDYGTYSYGDIESYNNIVANYISSLSTDMINFGNIVQEVWDLIPDFIESTLIVLFILGNSFIVYKLIKRR